MAEFSDAGCQQNTGTSIAAEQTLANFSELQQGAEALLGQALAMGLTISPSFDRASVDQDFAGRVQFDEWTTPEKPIPDYTNYRFNEPQVPTIVQLNEVRDISIDDNLPELSTALIAKMIAELCDVLQNLTDGLPADYVTGIRNRMHARIHSHVESQKLDFANDLARQGWTIPARSITPRINAMTQLDLMLHALAERDLRIHIYEKAVEVFKAVLAAAVAYFDTVADLYESYLDAQGDLAQSQIRENNLIVAELRTLVSLFEARSQNERTRINVLAQQFGLDAQLYGACIDEGGAIAARDLTASSLEGQRREGEVRDAVVNADASMAEVRQNVGEAVANIQTVLATLGRLMASHYQSLRTGASADSGVSSSSSKSCNTNYGYTETLAQT